jgi:hypothetical protein
MLVFVVVREESFHRFRDEAQQSNSARRCRRFGLHNLIFSIPNSAVGGLLSRLDFSISNALFDFGNFRFFSGQFGVSGLARPKAQLLVTAQADISSSIDRSRKDATISLGCIGPGGAA